MKTPEYATNPNHISPTRYGTKYYFTGQHRK
jgi:hypothetical protein